MKRLLVLFIAALLLCPLFVGAAQDDYPLEEKKDKKSELSFIGYYFMRGEQSNIAPTNQFLKGQVVGRIFGGNTTRTSEDRSSYAEQRFMPMFTYSPRLFDGWAKMRMSFEIDWTWGDVNYSAGGNFGGAFGADVVNIQTQNLFMEFRPQKNLVMNAGMLRLYDNVRVPYYTPTNHLVYKGYRLALFGSDASGLGVHYSPEENLHFKAGVYQLYENNVEQNDDVILAEFSSEYDLDVINSIGLNLYYLRDDANGEGGVSILNQGLNSSLSAYNGVFNFDLEGNPYNAAIFWPGITFHGNALLDQGRFGYNGFAFANIGTVNTPADTMDTDIFGVGANLRLAYKYGRTVNDFVSIDMVYTSGDDNNISDGEYSGVLTGNNWTAPGAVFFSHGLYLLLPHGNVVNRFNAAVIDIQNIGYGLQAAAFNAAYDFVPNKFRAKVGAGIGFSSEKPEFGGNVIGTELNLNLRYTPKVFMDLELHAAYLLLGDFYKSPYVNGSPAGINYTNRTRIPDDPWTAFVTLKWIMF